MKLPCTICGTLLQVKPDAEYVYCTMCGNRIDLGMHSYRSEKDVKQSVFCINCNRGLDPTAKDSIYSCYSCGENVCNLCAKELENNHYCSKCYEKIHPKIAPDLVKPKAKTKGKRKGKHKTKAKSKPKGKAKSQNKTAKKKKSKNKTKKGSKNIKK